MIVSKKDLKKITDEITEQVKHIFSTKLHKVILYGSYARGDANEDSDIDIIIIGDINDEEQYPYTKIISQITSDLGLEYNTIVSVTMENRQRFENFLPILPFYQNVISEGKELYVN